MSIPDHEAQARERTIILLVGLMQFVNILDFMMVMPLGPDFAKALGIPSNDIGMIGGIYTFAAAISGLVAALFLDSYGRKSMVVLMLSGLVLATLAGALAWDKHSMVAVRLIAGIFGGPLMSLGLAIIADHVPPERRGRAVGKISGAFAAASVLGVPLGLELAQWFSWHAPFLFTGALGAGVLLLVIRKLPYQPPIVQMVSLRTRARHLFRLFRSSIANASFLFMGLSMMAGFMIIPNISAHLQMNLHYPREYLGLLYLSGGAVSFFTMRGAGWFVDRTSSTRSVTLFTLLFIAVVWCGFIVFPSPVPVIVIFTLFMVCMSGRNISAQTLSTKVPDPHSRMSYMSVQSAVTHMASALGAYYSSRILVEQDGQLLHVPLVGYSAIAVSLFVPLLVYYVEKRLRHPR